MERLTALGDGVRHPIYAADAAAVAAETMRRVRHNVEMLIRRLDDIGYRFQDEVSSAEDQLARLEKLNDLAERMKVRAAAGSGKTNPQVQSMLESGIATREKMAPKLAESAAKAAKTMAKKRKPPLEDNQVFWPPDKATRKQLAKMEKLAGGSLPLSLCAWYEQVGGVSLMGSHPLLNPKQAREDSLPDPLVMLPLAEMLAQGDEGEGDGLEIVIAPDALHKADVSGDAYYLALPDAGADFVFDDGNGATFVNYLRRVFAWGGFPDGNKRRIPLAN